jgi:hypothetical protein
MTALPAVPSVLDVSLKWSYGSDVDVISRFFIQYSGTAPTAGQLDTFCAAVGAEEATEFAALRHSTTESLECTAVDLTSETSAQGTAVLSTVGTLSGVALPADNCALVSYEINRRYRGGHPRGYWPFGSSTEINSPQLWSSGFVTTFGTNVASFFSAILGDGWSGAGTLLHVNVSRFEGFTVVTNPVTGRARNIPKVRTTPLIDTVTALVARQQIASQRRRLGKK